MALAPVRGPRWRPPRVRALLAMGKRGAATAGVPADSSDDSCDADAVPPLAARWGLWRSQHPPRSYVGAPIQRVSKSRGLPADTSRHKAGGMWTRLQPNPGRFNCAASGASCDQVVSAEFLCVPLARRVGEGEKTPPLGASDDLFEHRDSASGDWFQHVTSVRRWLELAKTHPMVHTCYPYYPRRAARVLDEQGRAVSGEQGEFRLSLSLSATGNVFRVGMRAKNVAPPLVALWWRPMMETDWTPRETLAARRVFFDLCEVEADSLFPEDAEAQAKDEISGSAHAEGEDDSHGAGSSGASDVQGAPADDEQARAMDAHRQVHLGDVAWPVRQGPVLCSQKKGRSAASEPCSWSRFCGAWAGLSRIRSRSNMEFRTTRRGCASWACSTKRSRARALIAGVPFAERSRAWNLPLAALRAWSPWWTEAILFGRRCEARGG